jgi:hypothetical protein
MPADEMFPVASAQAFRRFELRAGRVGGRAVAVPAA